MTQTAVPKAHPPRSRVWERRGARRGSTIKVWRGSSFHLAETFHFQVKLNERPVTHSAQATQKVRDRDACLRREIKMRCPLPSHEKLDAHRHESLGPPGAVLPPPSPQGVNKNTGIDAGAESQSQPPPDLPVRAWPIMYHPPPPPPPLPPPPFRGKVN